MNAKKYLVFVEKCGYCKTPAHHFEITKEQYHAKKRDYDSGYHECTSSTNTIFGGGACCDLIGHTVTPIAD